ncbi:hypothetical protein JX266_014285 [Neoarthrinium moseri]|nr:hypothetical protein JX266_014285 [Neoarthrinium moseri]
MLGGVIPPGSGAVPSCPRVEPKTSTGTTFPLPSGMGIVNIGSAGGGSGSGILPLAPQKHEYDQNSVWALSSHSQTQSTRSDSHPDIMQWTAEPPP